MGIDVRITTTGVLVLVTLFALMLVRRLRPSADPSVSPPRQNHAALAVELACLVVLAVVSVAFLRFTAASHLDVWDGWAMWGPKAHALFVEGDIWGPVFRDPAYGMQHQEYPVLLPALEALSADAIGRYDLALIDIEPGVVLVALGWGVWAALRLAIPGVAAAAVALALTGAAPLVANAAANYADTVIAAFTALGLLCLFVWLMDGSAPMLVLAGMFLAAAASTKMEGLLFAVCSVAAAIAVARGFRRPLRSLAALAIGVLAIPLLWIAVDRLNGAGGDNVDGRVLRDPGYAAEAASRIPVAADGLLRAVVDAWPLASVGIVGAVLLACIARLWWHVLFVGLWGALVFSALLVVYYTSPAPVDWLLVTAGDRVVFSLVVGLAAVAPILVARSLTRVRSERAGDGDAVRAR